MKTHPSSRNYAVDDEADESKPYSGYYWDSFSPLSSYSGSKRSSANTESSSSFLNPTFNTRNRSEIVASEMQEKKEAAQRTGLSDWKPSGNSDLLTFVFVDPTAPNCEKFVRAVQNQVRSTASGAIDRDTTSTFLRREENFELIEQRRKPQHPILPTRKVARSDAFNSPRMVAPSSFDAGINHHAAIEADNSQPFPFCRNTACYRTRAATFWMGDMTTGQATTYLKKTLRSKFSLAHSTFMQNIPDPINPPSSPRASSRARAHKSWEPENIRKVIDPSTHNSVEVAKLCAQCVRPTCKAYKHGPFGSARSEFSYVPKVNDDWRYFNQNRNTTVGACCKRLFGESKLRHKFRDQLKDAFYLSLDMNLLKRKENDI